MTFDDFVTKSGKLEKLMLLVIVLSVIAALALSFTEKNGTRRAVAGIAPPAQEPANDGFIQVEINGIKTVISFVYAYNIEALVVHTKDYRGFSPGDILSPVDLGLAWGAVAQYNDTVDLHWSHGDRFLQLSYDTPSADILGGRSEIDKQVSNNHIIPANDAVWWQVRSIHRGDHIRLRGYLVNVSGIGSSGTLYWYSSTTREDTGDGACEVMYVTSVEWL